MNCSLANLPQEDIAGTLEPVLPPDRVLHCVWPHVEGSWTLQRWRLWRLGGKLSHAGHASQHTHRHEGTGVGVGMLVSAS